MGASKWFPETHGNYVYVTSNQGVAIINISNPSNPQYLGIVSGTNGDILENLDVYENFLAVAAHEDGVLFYDISNPSDPEYIYTLNLYLENLYSLYL